MVIGWNLLSSAASFPMVLRYSSAGIHQTRDDRGLATMTENFQGQTRGQNLGEGKHLRNGVLTCCGTNQLKPSGKGGFDHLTRIDTPLCFAQVKQAV